MMKLLGRANEERMRRECFRAVIPSSPLFIFIVLAAVGIPTPRDE